MAKACKDFIHIVNLEERILNKIFQLKIQIILQYSFKIYLNKNLFKYFVI